MCRGIVGHAARLPGSPGAAALAAVRGREAPVHYVVVAMYARARVCVRVRVCAYEKRKFCFVFVDLLLVLFAFRDSLCLINTLFIMGGASIVVDAT